mmetsp:Transcript_33526/g.44180  ORF Transcript_33526/g.44180 Transcript_33526/m.44180 type:complete len:111 (-) Transcript_33526:244-576(-)
MLKNLEGYASFAELTGWQHTWCSASLLLATAVDFDIKRTLDTVDQVSAISAASVLELDDSGGLLVDELGELCLGLIGTHASVLYRLCASVREGLELDFLVLIHSEVVVSD